MNDMHSAKTNQTGSINTVEKQIISVSSALSQATKFKPILRISSPPERRWPFLISENQPRNDP